MKKKLNLIVGLLLFYMPSFAQETVSTEIKEHAVPQIFFQPEFYVIIIIALIVIISFLTLMRVISVLTNVLTSKQVVEYLEESLPQEAVTTKESWLTVFWKKLNDSKPVEEERDILLDHDYDGIKELDNNLPPWWKYGFYFTIVFSIGYMLHFHVFKTGKLQIAEYNDEMEKARIQLEEYRKFAANNVDETNVVMLTEVPELNNGAEIYRQYCGACHGMAGEGNVGPNLTDEYWIYGGDIKDIFRIIKEGMPQKGMISWKQQLSPKQIQEVSSYIITLAGTNPPNAKEPQGEKLASADVEINKDLTQNK